jgi:hypothetical protein
LVRVSHDIHTTKQIVEPHCSLFGSGFASWCIDSCVCCLCSACRVERAVRECNCHDYKHPAV